jgi:hypothetical protein
MREMFSCRLSSKLLACDRRGLQGARRAQAVQAFVSFIKVREGRACN